mmetsp:Transcript_14610/g.16938  ORF Transcript_14610/g.16938 Transcript_14610/m.16938 type:complete len:272 (-) Transcript_14610:886-1701(-)
MCRFNVPIPLSRNAWAVDIIVVLFSFSSPTIVYFSFSSGQSFLLYPHRGIIFLHDHISVRGIIILIITKRGGFLILVIILLLLVVIIVVVVIHIGGTRDLNDHLLLLVVRNCFGIFMTKIFKDHTIFRGNTTSVQFSLQVFDFHVVGFHEGRLIFHIHLRIHIRAWLMLLMLMLLLSTHFIGVFVLTLFMMIFLMMLLMPISIAIKTTSSSVLLLFLLAIVVLCFMGIHRIYFKGLTWWTLRSTATIPIIIGIIMIIRRIIFMKIRTHLIG